MAEKPRIEMQGERNKRNSAGEIESGPSSQFSFDVYTSLELLLDKPLS
jgi:hypothetical protein